MNAIEITFERIDLPDWIDEYRDFVGRLLEHLEIDNWEISILLCDGQMIRRLNKSYRNKDEVTDVLSFPQADGTVVPEANEMVPAGDIVIALDQIELQAGEFDVPFMQELYRMTIHGVLHLMGQHHDTNDVDEPMLMLQEDTLIQLNRKDKS